MLSIPTFQLFTTDLPHFKAESLKDSENSRAFQELMVSWSLAQVVATCLTLSHPQEVPHTFPWLFGPWPPLGSPLWATHSPGPTACPMALAVSHVVQNGSQPISHRRHLLLFVLKALASPIAHRLTPPLGFTLSTPRFYGPIASILTASSVFHLSTMPSDFPAQTVSLITTAGPTVRVSPPVVP